ncbi:MAG TPA: DUF1800 domain-containing protein [Dehalococcoidia bacterium]|jgi:hypothetical protein|nr:DUF1800 domain-containing protein [Dehalococcoidia bacterium]PKB80744.1 MAG: hypothetical protein BZY84_08450 [SAR202 cluster bacterium MP-SInd-SRR3963457-G1]PKB85182.1 MAG: hypothetical protein BZY86_03600 [SAR202 cluster bacterium MP-NPac-SRR3961935-G1]RUA29911.1 MAG: hypothetical protein DSY78_11315 [Chloroflexota bacterium]HIM63202.1 DUF1800 domain-containing protein [Dehalococcoidia bacterium]
MPDKEDIASIAHLMRRAGFGASRQELEERAAKGYEATVEDLLHPEEQPPIDDDILYRFMPGYEGALGPPINQAEWVYRMVNTQRPLEEKLALFWHQLFATGNSKVDNPPEITQQIAMFRRQALGSFRDLLVELAKNPAMIWWLDNNGNHNGAINENWGRELLELFSMGVGNYSEDDIKDASRAFTGWTIEPKIPRNPLGRFYWNFEYRAEDHDDGEKSFLGQTGRFNGEDIIDIVVKQPATARFLARHLYNFFVADEPQVPSWNINPPNDPDAVDQLVAAYDESDGDLRSMMRLLFNSDFFKNARFARVKSPAELVVSTVKMAGNYQGPRPGFNMLAMECNWQGQELLNPPSVESWHTGGEWIDGGALVRRVNFAAGLMGDTSLPGIREIVEELRQRGVSAPEEFVDACLDLVGPLEFSESTRSELLDQATEDGELNWDTDEDAEKSEKKIGVMLALITASRDFQFA